MNRVALPLTAAALSCFALLSETALASGAEACGGVELSNVQECHFEWSGGCEANCTPWHLQAACDGECNAALSASCTNECTSSCTTTCEIDPGSFDCTAECNGDCHARAVAECGCDDDCIALVEASCEAHCEAECSWVPPSASCETQCNACCAASCDVEANVDCNLECTAELEGGCEVDCMQAEGALFCDGQYIPVQDIGACVDYMSASYSVDVSGEAEGSFGISCSTSAGRDADSGASLWALAFGLVALRRRRRQ